MEVKKLSEHGYDEAVLGFSLSYRSTLERTESILPKYAFGIPGENKFLESIQLWLDVTAPRFWHQEMDTYRVGISKQSESSMHFLCKKPLTQEDFELPISNGLLENLNFHINQYKICIGEDKKNVFLELKNLLPEGFKQRRIINLNYKCFRNIYEQRINHRLPQWQYFCNTVLNSLDHPEFIVKDYEKSLTDFH
jgi:hypothetical protein